MPFVLDDKCYKQYQIRFISYSIYHINNYILEKFIIIECQSNQCRYIKMVQYIFSLYKIFDRVS